MKFTRLNKRELLSVMKKKTFCAFNFKDATGKFAKLTGLPIKTVEMQTTDGQWYVTSHDIYVSLGEEKFTLGHMDQ